MQDRRFQAVAELHSATVASVRKLPPLGSLRAFEAAARHLSFEKAAAELGVTPTAISHQIRLLERHLRPSRCFSGVPGRISLTSAASAAVPGASRTVSMRSRPAIASVSGGSGSASPLRVTSTNAFAGLWLVPPPAALAGGAPGRRFGGDRDRRRSRPACRRGRCGDPICVLGTAGSRRAGAVPGQIFPGVQPGAAGCWQPDQASDRSGAAHADSLSSGHRPTLRADLARWLAMARTLSIPKCRRSTRSAS